MYTPKDNPGEDFDQGFLVPQDRLNDKPVEYHSTKLPQNPDEMEKWATNYLSTEVIVKRLSVMVTTPRQWINQNDEPYLNTKGCIAIAKAFHLQIHDVEDLPIEKLIDDQGEFWIYRKRGRATFQGYTVPEIGIASTRDKLFGSNNLSEVDLVNIEKKAHTNLMNRLIKAALGLDFTWEEIEEVSKKKINQEACTRFKYKKGDKSGKTGTNSKEMIDKREEMRTMILQITNGDINAARSYCEEITSYKMKDGTEVKGKSRVDELSDAQVNFNFDKVLKDYTQIQKDIKRGK